MGRGIGGVWPRVRSCPSLLFFCWILGTQFFQSRKYFSATTAGDKINRAQGRSAAHHAGEGLGERWRMRQKLKSAASTTGVSKAAYMVENLQSKHDEREVEGEANKTNPENHVEVVRLR